MAKFKQEQIIAGVTKTRTNALKVYCASAIAANDIIVATGMEGDFMSVEPADPGSISKCRGPFFVADYAASAGEYTALALPYKVVTGVDTSAAAQAGDAVYLSTVAGSEGGVVLGAVPAATADGAAFSLNVRVGRITKVHASLGSYVLSPGDANSTPMIGKVTCSGTSSTVTGFTAELDGAPVVVSMDANIATTGAVIASGTLTIHHASSTDDATYVIYA